MSVVDLHPEDLLDKDARGELTESEHERLEAHLARCSACRAERVLRADFFAELEGDDRPSAILGLVAGALKSADADAIAARAKAEAEAEKQAESAKTEEAEPEVEKPIAIPGLRRAARPRRTAVVLLCAAAAVLAASVAGASSLGTGVWARLRGDAQEVTHRETSPTERSARSAPPAPLAARVSEPIEEPATAIEEPEPAPLMAQLSAPSLSAPPVLRPVSFAPPAPIAAVSAPSGSSAGSLFDSANAARRSGDVAGALALYDDLGRKYPASREAISARATTGRLLLDSGDANGAVLRFDSYLASGGGELREEAMAGRASALERLGRDEDESRAWALLLATYPHTPYAGHARARIARSVPQ